MNPTLEIFSQGEEIVTGQTVDTNAAWLSQQATELGFTVTRHTAVGDKLDNLVGLLKDISQRADCCLCTGGLGPTSDDLTAEAVAQAFQLPLQFDALAYNQIKRFFDARNRAMPESNRKQAMLPKGAVRVDNHWGTAPGFSLSQGGCWFVFMPGVPAEMKPMFEEEIQPNLFKRFSLKPAKLISFRTLGIGESDIQERIKRVAIPDSVQLGFRADSDEVQVKLLFPSDYSEMMIKTLLSEIAEKLGHTIFAVDGWHKESGDLISVIDRLMTAGKHKLAVIETASQGLLAAKCIGSSWLLETCYVQSLADIGKKLSVTIDSNDLLATGEALAIETQKSTGADKVLVQLFAENYEKFNDKEQSIRLSCILLAGNNFHHVSHTLAGSAKRKQNQAALMTLDLLRRHLQPQIVI